MSGCGRKEWVNESLGVNVPNGRMLVVRHLQPYQEICLLFGIFSVTNFNITKTQTDQKRA